jgi:hypothetical protein
VQRLVLGEHLIGAGSNGGEVTEIEGHEGGLAAGLEDSLEHGLGLFP